MDLPFDLARRARRLGARFVASVDAHSTAQLAYLDNAITLARRAGLSPAHVLNTLPAEAFAAAVKPV
jgi:DNA polymerase (family 10)